MNERLAVHFYSINGNKFIGEGFYMPSMEFFKNVYIPEHFPEAIKLGTNKYQKDKNEDVYFCCECAITK